MCETVHHTEGLSGLSGSPQKLQNRLPGEHALPQTQRILAAAASICCMTTGVVRGEKAAAIVPVAYAMVVFGETLLSLGPKRRPVCGDPGVELGADGGASVSSIARATDDAMATALLVAAGEV